MMYLRARALVVVIVGGACSDDAGSTATEAATDDASGSESSASTEPTSTSATTTVADTSTGTTASSTDATESSSGSEATTSTSDPSTDTSGSSSDASTSTDPGTSTGSESSSDSAEESSSSSSTTNGMQGDCEPGIPAMPSGACADIGIVLQPPYDDAYTCLDLGEVPGVPLQWGGLVISREDPNVMLIGGDANEALGQLWAVDIARDADCHVVGFTGAASQVYAAAEYNDGGLTYASDDVLFVSRWPVNEMGQLIPGAVATSKVIDLDPFGVVSSPGGLTFVPPTFPGDGLLKAVSWPGGQFYTFAIAPDGMGTYDVQAATLETTIVGGPEAFVYIAAGNPEFDDDGMLVAEWSAGNIAAYDIDDDGDPIPATRADFITALSGAESAFVDPDSGDFLFATFAGVERMIVVQGFAPAPQ